MASSLAIEAAIISGVIAGVSSIVINGISVGAQYVLNRRHREWMERFQWRRETNAVVRELRRETLYLDVRNPDVEKLGELIQDLETQLDFIPEEYSGTTLSADLDDIRLAYHNYKDADGGASVVDLRTNLLSATETAESQLDAES